MIASLSEGVKSKDGTSLERGLGGRMKPLDTTKETGKEPVEE